MTLKLIQSAITNAGYDCHDGNTEPTEDDVIGQSGYSTDGTGLYVGECSTERGGGFCAYYLDTDGVPDNEVGYGDTPEDAIENI